jgi:hypothetical protein
MEPRRDVLSTNELYRPFRTKKPDQTQSTGPLKSCGKKLLVLDINGVLADVTLDLQKTLNAPKYIEKKAG